MLSTVLCRLNKLLQAGLSTLGADTKIKWIVMETCQLKQE